MRKSAVLGLLAATVERVYSQAAAYEQCGGSGWTGLTTCVTGFYCSFGNTSPVATSVVSAPVVSQVCTGSFKSISASAAFAALDPGWNLGNTLDALPTEGSWNNPPVTTATFPQIKAKGFKSVRIPVTWVNHFTDASPTWTVDKTWMDRVETVVDQALSLGLSVVLNVHHDSWNWADVTATSANYTMIEEKFSHLWYQIGSRFACKSSLLLFEAINEPTGSTQAHAEELNKLNDIFLKSINDAGGFNSQRVVSLSGLNMNSALTAQWFKRGTTYPKQPWGLQFHYYSPYDFIFGAWGKTIWGSDADKSSLVQDFDLFHGNFSTIPTFIGEWSASPGNTETAGRWKYYDFFLRTARKYGYSTMMWDNGADQFNRSTNTWKDSVAVDILFSAVKGQNNTLADSTTDPSATAQSSSAYLFHKVGDPVIAQSVSYQLNGNTLVSITSSTGTKLTSAQYSISATGALTLSQSYLSTLYTSTAPAGLKETLQLTFSSGAPLSLSIYQYATPTLAAGTSSTYALSALSTSSDLHIPITYAGLPQIAAVKALKSDGTYLADDWTVYLGPLQNARWTYGGWGWDAAGLTVAGSGVTTLKGAGKAVTLTVEFFPRVLGENSLNVTFTV
ncbi:glycoside hydrolase superfamily [Halenospora varia]|nr:glycoside hydrolase superfamily [Halenospora varia]